VKLSDRPDGNFTGDDPEASSAAVALLRWASRNRRFQVSGRTTDLL
jgi:hypothetical protein